MTEQLVGSCKDYPQFPKPNFIFLLAPLAPYDIKQLLNFVWKVDDAYEEACFKSGCKIKSIFLCLCVRKIYCDKASKQTRQQGTHDMLPTSHGAKIDWNAFREKSVVYLPKMVATTNLSLENKIFN